MSSSFDTSNRSLLSWEAFVLLDSGIHPNAKGEADGGFAFFCISCAVDYFASGTRMSPPVICFGSSSFSSASRVGEMSRSEPSGRTRY